MSFNDKDSYENPIEGKTYVSPPIKNSFDSDKTVRIITRAIDQTESYTFIKIKKEIVLRETPGGKNIIKAKVFENPRGINVLSIQEYTPSTGSPHKAHFTFIGAEIAKLHQFIKDAISMQFDSQRYQRLSDEDIKNIEITDRQALHLFLNNQNLFSNIVRNSINNEDIVTVGYRKKQLKVFEKLLTDTSYFDKVKTGKKSTTEGLWQMFFEKNQWIFGYGLGYVFLTGLDHKKLEQVVHGYDVNANGKRVDALMKTRGLISSLCFVEIKTHTTKLLYDHEYRSGCFAPSKELAGAIAQVQGSVTAAVKNLSDKIRLV